MTYSFFLILTLLGSRYNGTGWWSTKFKRYFLAAGFWTVFLCSLPGETTFSNWPSCTLLRRSVSLGHLLTLQLLLIHTVGYIILNVMLVIPCKKCGHQQVGYDLYMLYNSLYFVYGVFNGVLFFEVRLTISIVQRNGRNCKVLSVTDFFVVLWSTLKL